MLSKDVTCLIVVAPALLQALPTARVSASLLKPTVVLALAKEETGFLILVCTTESPATQPAPHFLEHSGNLVETYHCMNALYAREALALISHKL